MRKAHFLTILFFSFLNIVVAQIPNPGMETWASSSPTGWVGYNDVPSNFYTCVLSTDAHTGTNAAKLQITGALFIGGRMHSYFTQTTFPMALRGFYKSTLN